MLHKCRQVFRGYKGSEFGCIGQKVGKVGKAEFNPLAS